MVLGSVIVVGRGPSLRGSGKGREIDLFDQVVRLSNGRFGKDYGFRGGYVLTTYPEIGTLKLSLVDHVWFYDTPGPHPVADWTVFDDIIRESFGFRGSVTHINEHIQKWLDRYKEIAKPVNQRKHPHVDYPSKGTAAALAVKEILKPRDIQLVGMDNVAKGERTNHCHDWSAERAILREARIL